MHRKDQSSPEHLAAHRLLALTEPIPRKFFERPADRVAPDLLGTVLFNDETAGMLVETEAYLGLTDMAAHSSRGLTKRTEVMFGPAGHAYVYLIYGMHECLNVVTEKPGIPHGVLIRALEPLSGLELMAQRRQWHGPSIGLCNGPGKLTQAMAITRGHNGADLVEGPLQLRRWKDPPQFEIEVSPRIGIRDNADWLMRFTWSKHPGLSKR